MDAASVDAGPAAESRGIPSVAKRTRFARDRGVGDNILRSWSLGGRLRSCFL